MNDNIVEAKIDKLKTRMPYMKKCYKVIIILTIKAKTIIILITNTLIGLLKTYRFSSPLYSLSKRVSIPYTGKTTRLLIILNVVHRRIVKRNLPIVINK